MRYLVYQIQDLRLESYRVIPDVQRIEVPLSLSEMAYVSIKKSVIDMDWSVFPPTFVLMKERLRKGLE